MTVQENRTITCTRCGTLVPWAPHCPYCSAYLEFSGNPPWTPDDPESVERAMGPQLPDVPLEESADAADLPEPVSPPTDEELAAYEPLFAPRQADETEEIAGSPEPSMSLRARFVRGFRMHPERQLAGYLSAVGLAVIVDLLLLAFVGAAALWALPLLALWGVFVVGFFGTLTDGEEAPPSEEATEREEAADDDGPVLIWLDADEEFAARAPQPVVPIMERSMPLAVGTGVVRDVPCSECDRMNIAGHRFCDRCGAVLGDAVVAPPVVAVSVADREEEEREARRRQRRVTGSWRNPIIYLSLGLALLAAFVFAFLGPGAFQTRIGLTAVFQVIAQFIDPYAGSPARVETVTASSTLPGTDPSQAGLSDTRTFWASAPSVGYGAGSTLRFEFDAPVEINRLVIYPGIQNQQFDLRAVATPQQISLAFDDGSVQEATLQPLDSASDRRQLVEFADVTTGSVTMTIVSVYPPRGESEGGFGEVAISGLQFLQTPQPPAVFQVQRGGIRTPGLPGAPAQ